MEVPAGTRKHPLQELLPQFAEVTSHVFWVLELLPHEHVSYVSPAFEEVWRRGAQELYDNPRLWAECILTEDREHVHRVYERWLADPAGETFATEYRITRPDGEIRWIYDHGHAIRGAGGRIYRVIGIAEDVTRRKQTEAELRRSEQRFRQLADAVPQLIWTADIDGVCTFVNRRWLEYTGAPLNEVLGNNWVNQIHPDDRSNAFAVWHSACASGSEYNVEYRIRRHDGVYRWFEARGTALRDGSGGIVKWFGSSTDIDDARATLEALAREKERFATIAETAPGAIHSLRMRPDGTMQFPYASPRITEIYGFEPAALAEDASGILQLTHPEDHPRVMSRVRECFASHSPWHEEFRVMHPVKGEIWVEAHSAPRSEPDGSTLWHGFLMDITTRKHAEEALRASEERFRQLTDSVPQLIWRTDRQGCCDFVNQRWLEYTGVSPADVLGWGWLDQVHPDDRARTAEGWRVAFARERPFYAEYRIRRHDGAYRWFDTRGAPVRDGAGRVVNWYGSNTDIEEARALRESLREEKERFTAILSTAPGVIHSVRLKPDGGYTISFASPTITEIYGYTAEELASNGTLILQLVHPDDFKRVDDSVRRSHTTMTAWHEEFRVLHPLKGEIWVEGHSVPVPEADGSVVWHGFLTDVTTRKRGEEELRMSRAQLLSALESSGMGTWTWDIQKDRVWWDTAATKLLGRAAHETSESQQTALSSAHPDDRVAIQAALDSCRKDGGDLRTDFRSVAEDGTVRWISARGHVELDATGRPWRLAGVIYDTTDRKRSEEAQIRSQKMEALGTLAGGIAHDFNNILLAITGNTRLAITDLPSDHPVQTSLVEIERAALRATDLVRRILTFSRQREPVREVAQLQPIVEEALKMLRSTLPAMIDIKWRFESVMPPVAVDPTQMHQIIMNLATNAAHAIGQRSGVIELSLDTVAITAETAKASTLELREGRYARLRVSDNGCGMDRKTLERIFDPFFTTKPPGQGTGLGLPVVHGIVRSHGGAINVYSQPGKGSTFILYLPVANSQANVAEARPRDASRGHGEHVLYIDDEESLVHLASRVLERLGYHVTGHTDPGEAIRAFRADPAAFDVVVTDLSMPAMSGFSVADAIHELCPDVPVLLTSGYVRQEDKELAVSHGIRDLILKPNTVEELGHALDRVFRSIDAERDHHAGT